MSDHSMNHTGVPCCPELIDEPACDVVDMHYRLMHNVTIPGNRRQTVAVEVIIHARLERCSGPLARGDLVYSTTLLPGEKVRLFTADRRTRFSFDSASSLSYRNEQTSEERYYMTSMAEFMSDLNTRESGSASSSSKSSYQHRGSASGALETLFGGPSVSINGNHNASSTSDFVRELSQHARASHHRSETATRTLNSVSVGEVQSRSHAEGQSEDHFESASRVFENPNRCHAISFYFYQINKIQTVKLSLVSVTRRVVDRAADARVVINPPRLSGDVQVIPEAVRATSKERLEAEEIGRTSVLRSSINDPRAVTITDNRFVASNVAVLNRQQVVLEEALDLKTRQTAIAQVDKQLIAAGLLDKRGQVSEELRREFEFEVRSSLPTGGLLVRGCLDDCDICEPALHTEIDLELERKRLENELLKRKIELLDKAQEYRCCPVGADDVTP